MWASDWWRKAICLGEVCESMGLGSNNQDAGMSAFMWRIGQRLSMPPFTTKFQRKGLEVLLVDVRLHGTVHWNWIFTDHKLTWMSEMQASISSQFFLFLYVLMLFILLLELGCCQLAGLGSRPYTHVQRQIAMLMILGRCLYSSHYVCFIYRLDARA